jgi:hypothetical protein
VADFTTEPHQPDCDPGSTCVECYGCECGAVESTCTGPPCYSRDAYEQDADEAGWETSYG